MRLSGLLILGLFAAGCAGSEGARKPVEIPPRRVTLAGNGHEHDCIAMAEQSWSERESAADHDAEAGDQNALAMPRETQRDVAKELSLRQFDEAAAERARKDEETTARIRRALLDDPSLSLPAKSIKILTRDGKVTLRGSVRSAKERSTVERIARDAAGDAHVESRL